MDTILIDVKGNANEKIMNVMSEGNQSENKFFPEFMPIDVDAAQESAAMELEKLVRMCGSNAILY